MSYGRRPRGRPRALPIHSVDTEEQALDLLVNWCAMDRTKGHFRIKADWPDQDVWKAIASARRQLHLE